MVADAGPWPGLASPAPVEADREALHNRLALFAEPQDGSSPRCFTGAPSPSPVDANATRHEARAHGLLKTDAWGTPLYARCTQKVAEPDRIQVQGKAISPKPRWLKNLS